MNLVKKVSAGFVTGALALGLLGIPTPAAHADGFTTRPINTFSYSFEGTEINVPTGCFLAMRVNGPGLKVESTIANVECVAIAATIPGLFCNYRGKYVFKDEEGREYGSEETELQEGCGHASYPIPSMSPRELRTGSLCLELHMDGSRRGEACISVFP